MLFMCRSFSCCDGGRCEFGKADAAWLLFSSSLLVSSSSVQCTIDAPQLRRQQQHGRRTETLHKSVSLQHSSSLSSMLSSTKYLSVLVLRNEHYQDEYRSVINVIGMGER